MSDRYIPEKMRSPRQRVSGPETLPAGGERALEALRGSEELYRKLIEESFDGIFVQKETTIVFANQRLHEMLGYDYGQLLGLDHWMIYHRDYQYITRKRAKARMRGKPAPSQYEVKLQRRDGSCFYGEVNARAIFFDGAPGVQVWIKDITERKQYEETLQRRTNELNKRVKELKCLYGISKLLDRQDISLESVLSQMAGIIPKAWQYPESAVARITMEGESFRTTGFKETVWKQDTDIVVNGERRGKLEVFYLTEKPFEHEGPFLREERDLLDVLGKRIGDIIERYQAEAALRIRESELKVKAKELEELNTALRVLL